MDNLNKDDTQRQAVQYALQVAADEAKTKEQPVFDLASGDNPNYEKVVDKQSILSLEQQILKDLGGFSSTPQQGQGEDELPEDTIARKIQMLYYELPDCNLKDHLAQWFSISPKPQQEVQPLALDADLQAFEPNGMLKREIAELVEAALAEYGIDLGESNLKDFAAKHSEDIAIAVWDAIYEHLKAKEVQPLTNHDREEVQFTTQDLDETNYVDLKE